MSSCPECLRQVEPGSQFCVSCGAVLPDTGEMSFFATLFRDEPAPTVPEIDDDATRIRPAAVPAPRPAPPPAFTPAPTRPRASTPPPRPRRIGGIVVLIVVLVVAVAAAVAGVFALGGSGQQTQPTPTAAGATPTPTPTRARSAIPLPEGAKACSPDVGVNSATSCLFAQNVAAAVWAAGPLEPLRVKAHSPVTNRTYDLTCTRGEWIRCTGGTNAVVYVLPR